MVEREEQLDYVFGSLSDSTRRDILKQVSKKNLSIGQIATHYHLTFAAVAKHLEVLHRANLIKKSRRGKEQIVSISPEMIVTASKYLENYAELWENRLNSLDKYLNSINKKSRSKQGLGGQKGKTNGPD